MNGLSLTGRSPSPLGALVPNSPLVHLVEQTEVKFTSNAVRKAELGRLRAKCMASGLSVLTPPTSVGNRTDRVRGKLSRVIPRYGRVGLSTWLKSNPILLVSNLWAGSKQLAPRNPIPGRSPNMQARLLGEIL